MSDLLAQFKALPNDKKFLVVGGIGVGGFALYTLSKRGIGGGGGGGSAQPGNPPPTGGGGGGGNSGGGGGGGDGGVLAGLQDQLTKSVADQQATNATLLGQIQQLAQNSVKAFNDLSQRNQQGLQGLAEQTTNALNALGQRQNQQPDFSGFASQLQGNLQNEIDQLAAQLSTQYTGAPREYLQSSSGTGSFGGGFTLPGYPSRKPPEIKNPFGGFDLRGVSGYGKKTTTYKPPLGRRTPPTIPTIHGSPGPIGTGGGGHVTTKPVYKPPTGARIKLG